jgi:hypothetical protein
MKKLWKKNIVVIEMMKTDVIYSEILMKQMKIKLLKYFEKKFH